MIAAAPLASVSLSGFWQLFTSSEPGGGDSGGVINAWLVVYRDTLFGGEDPLSKAPEEKRYYGFDFANQKEVANGDNLTGTPIINVVRIKGSGSLTVGDPEITDDIVYFSLESGDIDDRFELHCIADTAAGWKLAAKGQLLIARR